LVGAVIVTDDDVVVGQGYHERAGEAHAEVHALDSAKQLARGATMYVTLEPCCHHGRTGPCTRRIIAAGVRRVVAAMLDPDPRVSGKGFDELRAHAIDVQVGVCEAAARRLNAPFLTTKTMSRPFVLMKAATSIDARVAARAGARTAISSREANQRSQRLRASIDALAVGSETVIVDDPLLTARDCYRELPLWRVIFDRRLRTPATARVFSTLHAGPVAVVTDESGASSARARVLQDAGAQLLVSTTLDSALRDLATRGVMALLVEGGPTLQRAFAEAGLVDRVHLVVAPHPLGGQGVQWLDVQTLELSGASLIAEPRGPDIWIEADVHRHR
jgi:diaminohydroxyphosphoribosylaminopyrimidine deaminase/5-amino-6-(5-phosphoribosylamino)uracil reductase